MKRLFFAVFLVAPALPLPIRPVWAQSGAGAQDVTGAASPLVSAQLNAQLREPIVNGDTNAARSAMLTEAEKLCDNLHQALSITCVVSNIQFNNGPIYGMQQPPGNFLFGNANFQLLHEKP